MGVVVRDGNVLSSAADVELKFAMRMREDKIQEAKIVIDRRPCAGVLGCDELLSRFLPPDAVLTVYWPEGNRTYRGGHR
ncbi:DddA-like double-stranded DNA deaminase toxin [Micromonospora sp. NPDC003197]